MDDKELRAIVNELQHISDFYALSTSHEAEEYREANPPEIDWDELGELSRTLGKIAKKLAADLPEGKGE